MNTSFFRLSFALLFASWLPACGSPSGSQTAGPGTPTPGVEGAPGPDGTDGGSVANTNESAPSSPAVLCPPGAKTGNPTGDAAFSAPDGTALIVRTPAGYDPQKPTPLIMVYAQAGKTAVDMESRTALTTPATARGYLIAYVDHLPPSRAADVQAAADAATAVQTAWCVDPKRLYLTGHSDGGSMTHLVTLEALLAPAAIAPSAAGVNGDYLAQASCPAAHTPHLQLHSADDSLFPVSQGFGADAAKWYAACSGCAATPSAPDAAGCVVYSGCMGSAEVRYCEGSGKHGTWPVSRNTAVLDFFDRFTLP